MSRNRAKHSGKHHPKEPQGKHNQRYLQQQIAQVAVQPQPKSRGPVTNQTSIEGYEWHGTWGDYFKLILLAGGSISLGGLALVYACAVNDQANTNDRGANDVAATGPSRPTSGFTHAHYKASSQTLFAQPAKNVPVLQTQSQPNASPPPVKAKLTKPQVTWKKMFMMTIDMPFDTGKRGADSKVVDVGTYGFLYINDMARGMATLLDLYHLTKRYGAAVMNGVASMTEIKAPDWVHETVTIKQTVDAYDIKPLHYAILTGRQDVFALLLALGADMDDTFKYDCYEQGTQNARKNIVEVALTTMFYDFPTYYHMRHVCTDAMIQEIFLTYLHRKNFTKVSEMMHFKLKSMDKFARRANQKTEAHEIKRVFSMLPSANNIRISLGDLTIGYEEFLHDVHFEWAWLKSSAVNKVGVFATYTEAARQAVLKEINTYLECFVSLIKGIDKDLTRSEYNKRRVNRVLVQHLYYPKTSIERMHYEDISIKLQDACMREFQNIAPKNGAALIEFMLEYLQGLVGARNDEYYHPALLAVVTEQLQGYAAQYVNHGLPALAHVLIRKQVNQQPLTLQAVEVNTMIDKALQQLRLGTQAAPIQQATVRFGK